MFLTNIILFMFFAGYSFSDPNFVFILTDDQDLLLNGMVIKICNFFTYNTIRFAGSHEKTVELLSNKGKTFTNAFANIPICCPSRSTILTGKYGHNTGVVNNSIAGNCSSTNWQNDQEPYSIAAILKDVKNYVTFYAGKYLNQYGSEEAGGTEHIPKGYDWWMGLKGNSRYYNYTLSINGTGVDYKDQYLTDVLANFSMDFLNNRPSDKPFFMTVATPASHAPFTPADRHKGIFNGTIALRTPSFNYSASDKHWLPTMAPKYLPEDVTILDEVQQHRYETLLAVDELVEKVVKKLEEQKVLESTYILFASDHGFHIGQFTQPWDKRQPYETDIRIPLIIRGPNITQNTQESYPFTTVDIAPTILDLAEIEIPTSMDGESLKKQILAQSATETFLKSVIIEYWGEHDTSRIEAACPWAYDDNLTECIVDQWCKCQDSKNNTYSCLMQLSESQQFKFCQFEDNLRFTEAYNITNDPYELTNIATTMDADTLDRHRTILKRFKECSGMECLAENGKNNIENK